MINKKQFDVLTEAVCTKLPSQRALAGKLGCSAGTVNKLISELTECGYLKDGKITADGLQALEPYRAKRAVFLAAGFGSRLVPVTLNTPKPLVRVSGKRMIDGLIDAVLAAGIDEIYVVRGYLGEQFDQLLYKYPMIKFLENPAYNESNNISSALCASDVLSNSYVFEADLIIHNPSLVKKYNYRSNFLGFKCERTDDWCFIVKDGVIVDQKIGGVNCYQEVGISYWDEADGKKLSKHLKQAYDLPGGRERYWDTIPLVYYKNEYQVEIRECEKGAVVEIDTFKELKAIDKTYDV